VLSPEVGEICEVDMAVTKVNATKSYGPDEVM
jgi:hypothetical protein